MADFSALLADPGFQFGLSLLGNAHSLDPFAKAQNSMMQFQKQQAEQQLMATQQTRMQQQTQNERQQQAIALMNFLVQRKLLNNVSNLPALGGPGLPQSQIPPPEQGLPPSLQDLLGAQGMNTGNTTGLTQQAAPPAGAPQINLGNSQPLPTDNGQGAPGPAIPQSVQPPDVTQQPLQPQVPVDKFGTPLVILNNLGTTESKNNPNAIGPLVPGQGHAIGKYQFMPGTTKMLAAQGIKFNPLNADQSRDAASQYLQMLLKQNDGDWQKTLAQYGGFKHADPTAYVNKVLAGFGPDLAPVANGGGVTTTTQGTPPPAAAAPSSPTVPNAGAPLLQAGAMMGMVNPAAGNVLVEAGKAMAPQNVIPNAIVRDPMTGKTVVMPPSPKEAQETANMTPNALGITPAGKSQAVTTSLGHLQQGLETNYDLLREVPQSLDALKQAKASIPPEMFTGPLAERKIAAVKALNSMGIPGLQFSEKDLANADVFRSQINQALLASVKSTGGRMSVPEMNRMESNFSGLTTNPKAMADIIDMLSSRYQNVLNAHNARATSFGEAMGDPRLAKFYTIGGNPEPTVGPVGRANAAPAMSLDDYLKKYRK